MRFHDIFASRFAADAAILSFLRFLSAITIFFFF